MAYEPFEDEAQEMTNQDIDTVLRYNTHRFFLTHHHHSSIVLSVDYVTRMQVQNGM